MAKVSILMNCYNGEKFLKEAIESVYLQSFGDWEIVFIDNGSSDSSAEIAQAYDKKIKYFKTESHISLGAARQFGLGFCSGKYIAFLDTDDVWLTETLRKLVDKIEEGDFALVYGGLINIDISGKEISKWHTSKKSGHIFESLLRHYDIPIVSSLINREKLEESKLNFDENIKASEEYCLFMQLAANFKIGVVNELLVKYRILDNSLTQRSMDLWSRERNYTLNKIRFDNNFSQNEYKSAFKKAFSRADYYLANYKFSKGDRLGALLIIARIMFVDFRYMVFLISLLLPRNTFKWLFKWKYGRNFD